MVNSYNFSVQDLSVTVINATKRIQTLADEKNIALNTVTFSIYLSMDNFWLKEAFETIMKNALTYADEGTIVNVVMKKAKDGLIIYISDQGKSLITDEKIFVRYRKLNNDPNHYGIGLDMANKIIEQHHGSIQELKGEMDMLLKEYINIQFTNTYVVIHAGYGGYKAPILIEGKLSEIDLSDYEEKEVLSVSGRADSNGIHFWI